MKFAKIPVNKIIVPPKQSRQTFDEESLKQLASSMQEVGQLQPVIVKAEGETYLLIAGERRLRATRKNKQKEIAAAILDQEINEARLSQIQLIENLQREDLNPLERAVSIQNFIDKNELTKKDASEKLGVPRTTLTEWLNILEVDKRYQREVLDEDSPLSLSHITLARALASRTGDPTKIKQLLDGVLKYNLSRNEAKQVSDLFHKYLHLNMEEAISAIILKRGHQKIEKERDTGHKKSTPNLVANLINSFNRIGENMEQVMEKVGNLDDEQKENLKDEFLYIYQLMEIMIPELKDRGIEKMIKVIRNKNVYN